MEKDNFAIEGMVCASCAQTVEKAVAQLPDVTDVFVNLATESMQVEHGSQVSVQKIMQAVKNAGYVATLSVCAQLAQTIPSIAKLSFSICLTSNRLQL